MHTPHGPEHTPHDPAPPSGGVSRPADPPARTTLLGALGILLVGAALGIAHNALGLASRPPHGVAWVAEADTTLAKLEDLDHPHPHPEDAAPDTLASSAVPAPGSSSPVASSPSARVPVPSPGTPRSSSPTASTQSPPPSAPRAEVPTIPDVPGPLALELATFRRLYDADAALVVDAREAEEYAAGHIAGAISLPYNDALAEPERAKRLSHRGRPIVVYCSSATCHLAHDLASFLVASGQRRVLVYEGGWMDWSAAGLPAARGTAPGQRP